MINKYEIRRILLSKIPDAHCDDSISNDLDSLTLYDHDSSLDMESFFHDWGQIVSWSEINSIQQNIHDIPLDRAVLKIIEILSWTIRTWKEGIKDGNINKVVISFIIAERLFLKPEEDLPWEGLFTNLIEQCKKILPKFKLNIDDNIHPMARYPDKKYLADYKESISNNDYRGIFIFFRALKFGGGIENINTEFIKVIIRVVSVVDTASIATNISNYSPLLMKFVVDVMSSEQIIQMAKTYQSESSLPLLIGFDKLLFTHDDSLMDEAGSHWPTAKTYQALIEQIASRHGKNAILTWIKTLLNLSFNERVNIVFTAYVAKNSDCFEDYVSIIDFTYDNSGEFSYDVMCDSRAQSDLDALSIIVYSKFFNHLDNLDYQYHPFIFTSYFKYIFCAITVLSDKSFSKYLADLETISTELLRSIYSWHTNKAAALFSKWIYWLLASKEYSHDVAINKIVMKHTYQLLDDSRLMDALKCQRGETLITFDSLKAILETPDSVTGILLPLMDKAIELRWS